MISGLKGPTHRTLLLSSLLGFLALTLAGAAGAATISLIPSANPVRVGDLFEVGIVVEGLGDGVAPSIGLTSIVFEFDETRVSFQRAVLSSELGFSLDPVIEGPGEALLFQSSLDDAAFLDAVQSPSFELRRVELRALVSGTALLGLAVLSLEEATGTDIPFQVNGTAVTIGTLRIAGGASPVPEPSSALVFCAGLLVLGRRLRRPAPGSTIS